ncbi:hypothetical protein [Hyphomonas sp.]|uniref:hypothetical protein n=1 Tax=Hyphomonas sp. TaxID=87 RepID=UPI0025C2FFF1|nr:hypothetical protein [Hyphomonas sp.]
MDALVQNNGDTIYDHAYTAQWTGGCVDKLRDGFGQFTNEDRLLLTPLTGSFPSSTFTTVKVEEGTLVRGRYAGLWCRLSLKGNGEENQKPTTCALRSGNVSLGQFVKDETGSWRRADVYGEVSESPEVYAPGSLEAESQRLIAEARAGSFGGPINLQGQAEALTDLVAGASIRLSTDEPVRSIRGKRVAIVLSTRTLDDLQRWTAEREKVIEEMQRYRSNTQFESYFSQFVSNSDPTRLVGAATTSILSAGGIPFAADDLSVLQDGSADYVLIVDWRYSARIPTSVRSLKAMSICALEDPCENDEIYDSSVSTYLVTRDMRAAVVPSFRYSRLTRYSSDIKTMRDVAIHLKSFGVGFPEKLVLPGIE